MRLVCREQQKASPLLYFPFIFQYFITKGVPKKQNPKTVEVLNGATKKKEYLSTYSVYAKPHHFLK